MTSICSLTFPDGWVVRLRAMYSQATYSGHLEGAITARRNDEIVRNLMRKAEDLFGVGHIPTHLIAPTRTTGAVIEGLSESGQQVRRESLPPVACIGVIDADAVPGADGCASSLIYDRARVSLDRHTTYIVAAYLAGAARQLQDRGAALAGSAAPRSA